MLNFRMRRSAPQPLNPAPSCFGPKCVAKPVLGAPPFEKAADNPYIGVSPVFAQTARNINNSTFFFLTNIACNHHGDLPSGQFCSFSLSLMATLNTLLVCSFEVRP